MSTTSGGGDGTSSGGSGGSSPIPLVTAPTTTTYPATTTPLLPVQTSNQPASPHEAHYYYYDAPMTGAAPLHYHHPQAGGLMVYAGSSSHNGVTTTTPPHHHNGHGSSSNGGDHTSGGGGEVITTTTTTSLPRSSSRHHGSRSGGGSSAGGHSGGSEYPLGLVTFPKKLLEIIENEGPDVIEWTPHGKSFYVKDAIKDVLAKYFRQTKLQSFQRQLNLYGFTRITKGPDQGSYYHSCFRRDRPDLINTIKRLPGHGARATAKNVQLNPEGTPVANSPPPPGITTSTSTSTTTTTYHQPTPHKGVSTSTSSAATTAAPPMVASPAYYSAMSTGGAVPYVPPPTMVGYHHHHHHHHPLSVKLPPPLTPSEASYEAWRADMPPYVLQHHERQRIEAENYRILQQRLFNKMPLPDRSAHKCRVYAGPMDLSGLIPFPCTKVVVVEMDVIAAATGLIRHGDNVAILCSTSRQDQLCLRSDLGEHLQPWSQGWPPGYENGGLYCPNVCFFRGPPGEGFPFLPLPVVADVIVVPDAITYGTGRDSPSSSSSSSTSSSSPQMTQMVTDRIRTLITLGAGLRQDMEHRNTVLLLSLWSCGAKGLPPKELADCYRTVLTEYAGVFKVVGFVVDDGEEDKGETFDAQTVKSTLDGMEIRVYDDRSTVTSSDDDVEGENKASPPSSSSSSSSSPPPALAQVPPPPPSQLEISTTTAV